MNFLFGYFISYMQLVYIPCVLLLVLATVWSFLNSFLVFKNITTDQHSSTTKSLARQGDENRIRIESSRLRECAEQMRTKGPEHLLRCLLRPAVPSPGPYPFLFFNHVF